ncbi:MAG: HAD-IA family hydrolase [Deltaproteobacteria bacterium]|nr:HAD-IA family hydrolase [Deltaproteobacteria bacterium]
MIETVLLDLGNVLVPFDFGRGAHAFAQLTGLEPVELKALMTGPKLHEICAGALHPFAFFDELAQKVGRTIDRERAQHAWCDIFTPDAEMIALADALASRHPTFLWSNIDPLHRAFLWPQLPCLEKFRGLHLSYELGAAKPAREFYLRALERGGIDPKRAVFVDDVPANLAAAAGLGITVVLHRSAAETREKLAALGVTP